jgi:voltage-gated potassium channel
MIALALLTLPLLIVDYLYIQEALANPEQSPTRGVIWWLTITGLTLIWLAFLVEFAVKIAIAECRIEYVKRNWLDLVIIIIPVLRPLRAAAVARTTRVFTLRGVGFKFCRYVVTLVVGLEATERYLHRLGLKSRLSASERELDRMTRNELMTELKKLRKRNMLWERWHEAEQAYLHQQGHRAFGKPIPGDDGPPPAGP